MSRKNLNYILLNNLFLGIVISTVSSCKKDDNKETLYPEQHPQFQTIDFDIVEQHKKEDEELLTKIKGEVDKLEIEENSKDFFSMLRKIHDFFKQISDKDKRKKASQYVKDHIKFNFTRLGNSLNLNLGGIFIPNINNNQNNFYRYCCFAEKILNAISEDNDTDLSNYKIDIELYHGKVDFVWLYRILSSFPEQYFSTTKTFYFDVDEKGQVIAGWGDSKRVLSNVNEILDCAKMLFFIYDLNPELVDKNFDLSKVVFKDFDGKNILEANGVRGNFFNNIVFVYKNKDFVLNYIPVKRIFENFDFDNLDYDKDTDRWMLKSNKHVSLIFSTLQTLNVLIRINFTVKNKKNIIFRKKNIEIGSWSFDINAKLSPVSLIKNLEIINVCLDNFKIINPAKISVSMDTRKLSIGDFDLLNFKFETSASQYFDIRNTIDILGWLFALFGDHRAWVEPEQSGGIIECSNQEKIFLYKYEGGSLIPYTK